MAQSKVRWVVLFVILFLLLLMVVTSLRDTVGSDAVLVVDLGGEISEQKLTGPGAVFGAQPTLMYQVLDVIDAARDDSRILGIAVRVTGNDAGWGKLTEIRERLIEFRKSGKPSICFMYSDLTDNRQYYLATGCDQVWLVPTGSLGVTGMMAQGTFVRGTLDKLGIYPDMYGIAEYKNYRDMFTQKKFTPAHREAAEALMRAFYGKFLADVAEARQMDRAEFEKLVNAGPFLDADALKAKLVDKLAYWDEVQQFFRDKSSGGEWNPVDVKQYAKTLGAVGGDAIAVVHATGTIVVGQSGFDPITGGAIMGSESVSADLRRARDDDSVKAIVLRVDSGGGSAVASEIIRREVVRAREKKPVVVSMSDVAASGGYWISMSASKILAGATTVTGSIGVVYGKMNISGLYNLLGLSTDHVATSENATFLWPQQNFTPAQREMLMKQMRGIYDSFIAGVADGRKMKVEDVDKIGKGRVWAGGTALELGLVDEAGGYTRAVEIAKELADIPAEQKVRIERYPKEKT
ncbi:MAG TPA: signal peptide peptidase SppA, partial [Candidatus Acidoferrales bacterium]